MTLVQTSPPSHSRGVTPRRSDPVLRTVLALATLLSVVAFLVTYQSGNVLAYNDAISHMMIARRTMFGSESGIAQLGSVWLPLQHVLMLPLIGFDALYYSGIAGAIVSMVSFIAGCGFAYAIIRQLTGSKVAGVVAAAVLALNVNVLYMQSTPMTELPLFAALLGGIYFIQVWIDRREYRYLVGGAVAMLAATLTRYEAWPVLAIMTLVVVVAAWRENRSDLDSRQRRGRVIDLFVVFLVAAFVGIGFWLVWNQVLFGDMFAFQGGEYAKPSLWLTSSEPAIGNWSLAFKTFYYATIENVPWPVLIMAGLGLLLFIECELIKNPREHKARGLVILSMLVLVPFFILAIYTGQRPLHVLQVNDGLYNVRFGLIMAIPAALFAGYLVGFLRKFKAVKIIAAMLVIVIAGFFGVTTLQSGDVVTLNDPVAALKEDRAVWAQKVIDDFKPMYDGGLVLIETFGNERLAFKTVPSDQMVYEGTNKNDRWKKALANPADGKIRWIVMRCVPGYRDKVCDALENNSAALAGYTQVYTHPAGYKIYKKVG